MMQIDRIWQLLKNILEVVNNDVHIQKWLRNLVSRKPGEKTEGIDLWSVENHTKEIKRYYAIYEIDVEACKDASTINGQAVGAGR